MQTYQLHCMPGIRLLFACGHSKTALFSFVLQPIPYYSQCILCTHRGF